MKNFAKKPSEIDFLKKYSQAKTEEEKARLEKEYDEEEKAYWDWMDNVGKEKEGED